MHEPSLTELKAFDATARAGSMSAAARLLGLRQPTISAHIAHLESAWGVELFFRRGRRVELTEFGRTLRDATNRIFRAEEDALALLASARGQIKRLGMAGLRRCQRGDLGQIGLRFEQREDQLIDLRPGNADLVAGLLSDGRSLRLATAALIAEDPGGSGMALPLTASDRLNALIPLGL